MRHIFVSSDDTVFDFQNAPVFTKIQEALQFLSDEAVLPTVMHLAPGIYHEKLVIRIPWLTIVGFSPETTKIVYDDSAFDCMPDGSKRGTFRSYTLLIDTHDFTACNLTIENGAGNGDLVGQAVAVYADGDHVLFDHCSLIGYQDTLFTGPLPPAPYEPGGFTGPKEFSPRMNGHQYYRNCFITGTVDFIFGSATAYFENCRIHSRLKDNTSSTQGYVTAASTPKGQTYGYVFSHCDFTGNCPDASVYLGRPWRDYAKTVLIGCTLGRHIHPDGFHDWNKPNARKCAFFAIDRMDGLTYSPSSFFCLIDSKDTSFYSKQNVLDGWGNFPLPTF